MGQFCVGGWRLGEIERMGQRRRRKKRKQNDKVMEEERAKFSL
jgi:hypothetical protein